MHIKVCSLGDFGYTGGFDARRWWNTESIIESVISSDNRNQEYKFRKRMTE